MVLWKAVSNTATMGTVSYTHLTGMPGQYVPLKETLRGFKMILNGECDELPESAFLLAGTIDDVFAKAKKG